MDKSGWCQKAFCHGALLFVSIIYSNPSLVTPDFAQLQTFCASAPETPDADWILSCTAVLACALAMHIDLSGQASESSSLMAQSLRQYTLIFLQQDLHFISLWSSKVSLSDSSLGRWIRWWCLNSILWILHAS
jgi:hypothetical protein